MTGTYSYDQNFSSEKNVSKEATLFFVKTKLKKRPFLPKQPSKN